MDRAEVVAVDNRPPRPTAGFPARMLRCLRRYGVAVLVFLFLGQLVAPLGNSVLLKMVWCQSGNHLVENIMPPAYNFPHNRAGMAASSGLCVLSSYLDPSTAADHITSAMAWLSWKRLGNLHRLVETETITLRPVATTAVGSNVTLSWSHTGFHTSTNDVQLRTRPKGQVEYKTEHVVAFSTDVATGSFEWHVPCSRSDAGPTELQVLSLSEPSNKRVHHTVEFVLDKPEPGSTCAWQRLPRECRVAVPERKDAGWPGVTRDKCLAKAGACFDDTYTNAPNCFFGLGAKPASVSDLPPIVPTQDRAATGITKPSIVVSYPDDKTVVRAGTTLPIRWGVRGTDPASFGSVQIRLVQHGTGVVKRVIAASTAGSANQYAWEIPCDQAPGDFFISVVRAHKSGEVMTGSDWLEGAGPPQGFVRIQKPLAGLEVCPGTSLHTEL